MTKVPFDLDIALGRIEAAIQPFPKAGLFELQEEGYDSPFEILVACILSVRTLDEVMLDVARELFRRARTPAALAALPPEEFDALIRRITYHEAKTRQIQALALRVQNEYAGELPCDRDVMLSFAGVGPKCANLVMGIACGEPYIAVDTHVHRVTNRWGYVQTRTPEETLSVLEAKVPREHWITLNRVLMPFGKFLCTGKLPHCSTCPVLEMCQQVGVEAHR